MRIDGRTISPEDGKILRRKSDGWQVWGKLTLGYAYYIGGKRLEEPVFELPEHYEEVDLPPMTEEERMMYEQMKEEERLREEMERELNNLQGR